MRKFIAITAIVLAFGLIALFVLHLQRNKCADPGPTIPDTQPEQSVPTGEATAPEAPEYTFPQDQPLPTGTPPEEESSNPSTPTAAPGLDEDETPHMEV